MGMQRFLFIVGLLGACEIPERGTGLDTPVAAVVVTPSSGSLALAGTIQLNASALDTAGHPLTGRLIAWSSSADAVATVNESGMVTGIAAGNATITATSEGKSGAATVT